MYFHGLVGIPYIIVSTQVRSGAEAEKIIPGVLFAYGTPCGPGFVGSVKTGRAPDDSEFLFPGFMGGSVAH